MYSIVITTHKPRNPRLAEVHHLGKSHLDQLGFVWTIRLQNPCSGAIPHPLRSRGVPLSTREHIRWVLPSPHSPSPGHDPFSFCPGSCRISRMHRPHSLPPIWLWHVAHSPHGPCACSLNLPSSPTFAIPEVGDRHLVGSETREAQPAGARALGGCVPGSAWRPASRLLPSSGGRERAAQP